MDTVRHLVEKSKAGYPALYLLSTEDQRSIEEIVKAATQVERKLSIWTFMKGVEYTSATGKKALDSGSTDPMQALKYAGKMDQGTILVLRHFHHFLEDPSIQATLLDLIPSLKTTKRQIIILTPVLKIPAELEKEISLVEAELPTKAELLETFDGIAAPVKPTKEMKEKLVEAALGLTTTEAEAAFSLAFIRPNLGKDPAKKSELVWDPSVVMDEKCNALQKTGILEYHRTAGQGLKKVGGMDLLKEWVGKRKGAFSDQAREFGLPTPKGLVMVGPPGTGKSLGASAMAEELGLPLIRVDMGAIFGGLVGESEANARKVIKILEAVSPCVGWLDEIEKGFAGSVGGALDSGVGARVLGTFLTWMQNKTKPVFIYATANNVRALPPEILRKGRFDEMFSVMLPNPQERKEIFTIHINKKNRGHLIEKLDLDSLVGETDGFSGSEIEATINDALYSAFSDGKDLNMFDLVDAVQNITPLSKTMKDEIEHLTEWCKGRTRPANKPAEVVGTAPNVARTITA